MGELCILTVSTVSNDVEGTIGTALAGSSILAILFGCWCGSLKKEWLGLEGCVIVSTGGLFTSEIDFRRSH